MANGASIKIGVDVTQFKQGMQQAQQSAKTLNAQMKANESQFKATGDKEKYLTEKGKLLKQQLDAQKTAAANAEKALDAMQKNGVKKTSTEYQKMEQALAGAQAAMYDTQAAMNSLTDSEGHAASQTDKLASSLNSINKKVSLDTVVKGIDSITGAMEKAGTKAVEVGRQIWDNIMDSAEYADNIATLSDRTGVSIEKIQQMEHVANQFEAPAETMAKTWKKVRMAMTSDSEEVAEAFRALRVETREMVDTGFGMAAGSLRNYEDVFWDIGTALMRMSDESERERKAQTLLGRSWDELAPLFKKGRKEYEKALAEAPTASDAAVKAAADLNDRVKELEASWQTLKLEAIEKLAPVLDKAASALQGFLDQITEYLQTEPGQRAMESLASAVEKVFTGLTDLDPDEVVQKFSNVVSGLTSTFEWITEHGNDVKLTIEGIAAAFAGLKIAQGVVTFMQLLSGANSLRNAKQLSKLLDNGGTGTGTGAGVSPEIASQNVTNQNVTNGSTATEHVTTMYVQNMVGGNGMPGTNPTGGGGNGYTPLLNDGSGGMNGYVPVLLPGTGTPATGTGGGNNLGNAALDKLTAGSGGGDVQIGGDHSNIYLKPEEFKIDGTSAGGGTPAGRGNASPIADISIGPDTVFFGGSSSGAGVGFVLGEHERLMNLQKGRYVNPKNPIQYSADPVEGWDYVSDGTNHTIEAIASGIKELGKVNEFINRTGTAIELGKNVVENEIVKPLENAWEDMKTKAGLAWNVAKDLFQSEVIEPISDSLDELFNKPRILNVQLGGGGSGGGGGTFMYEYDLPKMMQNRFGYANGLFSVPWDGYPAILHKGERVVPAREAGRHFTSNLYVENMNMNGGLSADALAASIAARNRRVMAGYGS